MSQLLGLLNVTSQVVIPGRCFCASCINLFVTHAAGAAAYCTHPPVLMPRERRHDLFVDYTAV